MTSMEPAEGVREKGRGAWTSTIAMAIDRKEPVQEAKGEVIEPVTWVDGQVGGRLGGQEEGVANH